MGLFSRRKRTEHVTVVVDETNVQVAIDSIGDAKTAALKEIRDATRKLETVTDEAKTERGRLEAAVATARRRGRGRW